MNDFKTSQYWALILGGSSGFGLATAHKLSTTGMNICIVHRDRRSALPEIEKEFEKIKDRGVQLISLNTNALDENNMDEVLSILQEGLGDSGKIKLLLHSIAFGNLKALAPAGDANLTAGKEDFEFSIRAMGTNIYEWTRKIMDQNMLATDSRIIGLTSEGRQIGWKWYGVVAAAKGALEALIRNMAVELAPFGIRCNVVQAGVTDTPAFRLIPDSEKIKRVTLSRNPFGRLTQPQDVADVIYLLCQPEAAWINGAIICVDGGESISGL